MKERFVLQLCNNKEYYALKVLTLAKEPSLIWMKTDAVYC